MTENQSGVLRSKAGHQSADMSGLRLRKLAAALPSQAVPELSSILGGVAARLETEWQNAEQLTGGHASSSH